jgi:hypothetical protein
VRSAAAAEAGASHVTATDVHTAATADMHATSDMRRAAEVTATAASDMRSSTSDMRSATDMGDSAMTPAASLRWRREGAAGQNRHQTESDTHSELCHGD